MTPNNEKTAAEGATSTTAQENLPKDSVNTVYLLKDSGSTRFTFGTWSGALLPKSDYVEVAVNFSDLQTAYKNGKGEFTLNQECAIAHDGEIRRLRAEKEEQRRQEEERRKQRRIEKAHKRLLEEVFAEEIADKRRRRNGGV